MGDTYKQEEYAGHKIRFKKVDGGVIATVRLKSTGFWVGETYVHPTKKAALDAAKNGIDNDRRINMY